MPAPTPRRFTLRDAMILLVAVAAGLAVPRTFDEFYGLERTVSVLRKKERGAGGFGRTMAEVGPSIRPLRGPAPSLRHRLIDGARLAAFWPGVILAPLTAATLALGSRRHATRRRLRAGMVAAAAVLLAAFATATRLPWLLGVGSYRYTTPPLRWWDWWVESWFTLPRLAGFAVAVAWLTLWLGGRWKVGRDWPDRLGVALGACWLGMALLDLSVNWLRALLPQ